MKNCRQIHVLDWTRTATECKYRKPVQSVEQNCFSSLHMQICDITFLVLVVAYLKALSYQARYWATVSKIDRCHASNGSCFFYNHYYYHHFYFQPVLAIKR